MNYWLQYFKCFLIFCQCIIIVNIILCSELWCLTRISLKHLWDARLSLSLILYFSPMLSIFWKVLSPCLQDKLGRNALLLLWRINITDVENCRNYFVSKRYLSWMIIQTPSHTTVVNGTMELAWILILLKAFTYM